ncbi:hypothetical protein Vadar_032883 [Vaccinium darrowii]|uniref:Uncharacterized protein n=1 Tax=Vaccinium darrowii TaxID=229202 RepID=A0ACB7Z0M8_9ERIC|nr:hypothetical protein Vadar_032883 [Vaccinium darrowii]
MNLIEEKLQKPSLLCLKPKLRLCVLCFTPIQRSTILAPRLASALKRRRNFSCFLSSSSFPYSVDSSSLRGTQNGFREERTSDLTKCSEFNVLISEVCAATSVDEIFMSLSHDHVCNALQISNSILGVLLNQFRDDWKSALGIFRWAKSRPGYKPLAESYDMMVDILGNEGTRLSPCVISYSTIIQSYCRQSNFHKVYELLDDMQAQGCPPNVFTYTTIMYSLAKSGEFEEALQIPERMRFAGCKPDTLFYNALIHTLGRANRLQEAVQVFEVEMPNMGIVPNTSTYNSMIAMFCHHAELGKAIDVLKELENSPFRKPDAQSYCPLLKSCFKYGKTDSWLCGLLDDMHKQHISLDLSSYTFLIHGLCRANKCEWAYLLFEEMIGQDIAPRYQTCQLLLDEIKQNEYL